jgi:hypothetical protein
VTDEILQRFGTAAAAEEAFRDLSWDHIYDYITHCPPDRELITTFDWLGKHLTRNPEVSIGILAGLNDEITIASIRYIGPGRIHALNQLLLGAKEAQTR